MLVGTLCKSLLGLWRISGANNRIFDSARRGTEMEFSDG